MFGWVYSGYRPLVGLDDCFLKGKFGGFCLVACALDENNGMFPIKLYICGSDVGLILY